MISMFSVRVNSHGKFKMENRYLTVYAQIHVLNTNMG